MTPDEMTGYEHAVRDVAAIVLKSASATDLMARITSWLYSNGIDMEDQ